MKGSHAKLMYTAPPCGWVDTLLTRITLGLLFFLTLAYLVVVPALFYYGWQWWPSAWIPTVGAFIVSTLYWAQRPWREFSETRTLEAWRRYFRFKVWRDQSPPKFEQTTRILFAVTPHGLFPLILPLLSGIQTTVFPELPWGIRTAVADIMFKTPILSPIVRWLGCISASKTPVTQAIQDGSCIIIPDGMAGAFHSDSEEELVYLAARTGFIRTALQQGALLVPVYCFGHTQLWDVWPKRGSWLAQLSRRFQYSFIWFWGEWWMPPLPRRVPLTMVVGKGIMVPQVLHPTEQQVQELHQRFTQSLSSLYTRYRSEAGYPASKHLLIV